MNFLAHAYLADDTPDSLIGNLGADFLGGPTPADVSDAIRAGIQRHHFVDEFTDSHPVFLRSKARIRAACGHFSGVLMDVFYDHFLSKNWVTYSAAPLPVFVDGVYGTLRANATRCPEGLRKALPHMVEENWLLSYGSMEGIETTLRRIARRLSRPAALSAGVEQLAQNYDGLQADFLAFFPELVTAVRKA